MSTNMDSGMFSTMPIDCRRIDFLGSTKTICFRTSVDHDEKEPPELETRGWTFQEFLLPSRVLHFGPFDVEWRCRERHTCECGKMDLKNGRLSPWHRRHTLAEIAANIPENEGKAPVWWEGVVYAYTQRDLTNATDKLPALSGMAQLYRQGCQDTYLAGLWKGSLLHDLCWHYTKKDGLAGSGGVGRRPAQYRALS